MSITQYGLQVLARHPTRIDIKFLSKFPKFIEFRQRGKNSERIADTEGTIEQTPEEILELGYQNLRRALAKELLEKIKTSSPSFFENLVIDLLVAMGYGGSRNDAAQVVGKPGDEGIDGVIKEDKLGLDAIYIQAKKWENSIGRPVVQAFAGSLEGQRARKGIFITSSYFTEDAKKYVERIEKRIVLVDGDQLTQLMMDYGIGVAEKVTYVVKRIDEDYFNQEL
jgi:restriction system protein